MIKDFHKTAIITKEHEVSYTELIQHINEYSKITPRGEETKTIIFSENREEWIYAFFSIWQNKGIAVPVDASSTVSDLAYILNDCHPSCIWTSESNIGTAREAVKETGLDITILSFDDIPAPSAETIVETNPDHQKDAIAVIIYTSGTTGSPKGVMLTFANLWANMAGVCDEVPIFNENRRTIMLLPVHHILPLMGTLIIPIIKGGGIAICPSMTGGDIMDTLQRGKISIFIGVPRLWQTLYTGIKKKIDERAVTRSLFNMCAKAKNRKLSRTIFKQIHQMMGGHLDYCVSGGAALDKEISEGLRTLGLDLLEGYGMTETAPIIAFTRPDDIIPGCVGLPLPSVQCKLINGELCAKGPNVMKGYYNRPEETAAVIDQEGFIHTGDLARIDERGRVYITGRTKEIIVLSNGKNVQPNEIEYKLEKYDTQIKECAITEKDDMLLAIIVPQEGWAAGFNGGKTEFTADDDAKIMEALKREVVEPYNLTVENYKKVMRIFVYHGELPRTKLDKIQRFKLKDIISGGTTANKPNKEDAASYKAQEAKYSEEFKILKKYIEGEKKLPVTPTSHLETDLGFDSLDKVGLQSFIEQTFGMEINADEMASFTNVQAIADRISKQKTRVEVEEADWHKILHIGMPSIKLPKTSAMYRVTARTFTGYLKKHNKLTIIGSDNIPVNGPFILAPNHQSYVDGPIVMSGVRWETIPECYFYATEEHVKSSFAKWMARNNNVILMERRNLKNSILKLAEVLKYGKNIIIFPEGSRTHDGKMTSFKKTFAILSKELNVPIVPVCIRGAYEAMPRGTHKLKTSPIEVEYLPPVMPSADMTYEELSELVKSKIQAVL